MSYLLLAQLQPTTAKQALSDPQWQAAMQVEYDGPLANNTWTFVNLPSNSLAY